MQIAVDVKPAEVLVVVSTRRSRPHHIRRGPGLYSFRRSEVTYIHDDRGVVVVS
jgi:hypothetical protein